MMPIRSVRRVPGSTNPYANSSSDKTFLRFRHSSFQAFIECYGISMIDGACSTVLPAVRSATLPPKPLRAMVAAAAMPREGAASRPRAAGRATDRP